MKKETKEKIIWIAGGAILTTGLLYFLFKKKVPNLNTNSKKKAYEIGINMGLAYALIDPRHWTENDQAAEDLISSVPISQIPQLEADYKELFDSNLAVDLQKNLSGWDNVSYKFTPGQGGISKTMSKIKLVRPKK